MTIGVPVNHSRVLDRTREGLRYRKRTGSKRRTSSSRRCWTVRAARPQRRNWRWSASACVLSARYREGEGKRGRGVGPSALVSRASEQVSRAVKPPRDQGSGSGRLGLLARRGLGRRRSPKAMVLYGWSRGPASPWTKDVAVVALAASPPKRSRRPPTFIPRRNQNDERSGVSPARADVD